MHMGKRSVESTKPCNSTTRRLRERSKLVYACGIREVQHMDAKKLGLFIAQLRKENNLTQAELAQKLQVTDKAVSKWERGVGLPDINTIEPLASALGVSVLEVMKAERLTEDISREDASAVLTDTFHLAQQQRKQARKNTAAIIAGASASLGLSRSRCGSMTPAFSTLGACCWGLPHGLRVRVPSAHPNEIRIFSPPSASAPV